MARSLNELMSFLRGEIALCGQLGASPGDILTFIDAFYQQDLPSSSSTTATVTPQTQKIDRRFQEKVWTWLARDSEVKFVQGKNNSGKTITLAKADAREGPTLEQDDVQDDVVEANENAVRLFVSDDRTWHAVAGHAIDHKKVPPHDFVLLGIIAGRKEKGILQSQLTRLSGQDKRSVPTRTQRLADRGYIEKRSVKAKGTKTSLLIHSRYQGLNTTKEREEIAENFIDFTDLVTQVLEVLKVERIITHDDLKKRLKMEEVQRAKSLSKSIRKLERVGVVKRVRAESEQSKRFGTTHKCVKLIREPDLKRDLALFHKDSSKVVLHPDGVVDSESDTEDEADEEIVRDENQPSLVLHGSGSQALQEVDLGRILPNWTPDRHVHNMLFDIIERSGLKGITTWRIKSESFGSFFRRPLEHVLGRLVVTWQLSQPLHLRHLALIRDTEMTGTVSHYVHFTFGNFTIKVEKGSTLWEAVESMDPGTKKISKSAPAPTAQPDLDQYGFPRSRPRYPLFKGGNASIRDCLRASNPEDWFMTSFDPQIKELEDGKHDITWPRARSINDPIAVDEAPVKETPVKETPVKLTRGPGRPSKQHKRPTLGRPRKYPPGEELYWLRMKNRQTAANQRAKAAAKQRSFVDMEANSSPMTPKMTASDAGFNENEDDRPVPSRADATLAQGGNLDSQTVITPAEPAVPNGEATLPEKRARKKTKKLAETIDPGGFLPVPESVDDKWNAEAARFADRSNPGVYITPKGRRKCEGKKGRPPLSRIAIFKSPRLNDLQWFAHRKIRTLGNSSPSKKFVIREAYEESVYPKVRFITSSAAHSYSLSMYAFKLANQFPSLLLPENLGTSGHTVGKLVAEGAAVNSSSQASPQDTLAPEQIQSSETILTSSSQPTKGTKRRRSSPKKSTPRKRLQIEDPLLPSPAKNLAKEGSGVMVVPSDDVTMIDASTATPSEVNSNVIPHKPKAAQAETTTVQKRGVPAIRGRRGRPPNKKNSTTGSTLLGDALVDHSSNANSASVPLEDPSVRTHDQPISEDAGPAGGDEVSLPDLEVQEADSQDAKEKPRGKPGDRLDPWGGSMAMLRKKIVMDIIEAAGGVFPGDNEMWYPFMTKWMKTGRSETVDRRTVKTNIKYLVDSAKLRQLKFTFKDHKGVMVTRTIITQIEISPSDAKVKAVQKMMMAEDPQLYFPPGTEIDPELRKRSDVYTTYEPRRGPRHVPTDTEQQVKLDHVPTKYQSNGPRKRKKGEKEKSEKQGPAKKPRTLIPKGSDVPPMRNVARLQTLNVKGLRPRTSGTETAAGSSQLDFLETEQGRLAPVAGASGFPSGSLPLEMIPQPFPSHERHASEETTESISTHFSTTTSQTRSDQLPHSLDLPSSDQRRDNTKGPTAKPRKVLPTNLDEFIEYHQRDCRRFRTDSEDHNEFTEKVGKVMKWELDHPELFEAESSQIHFINHELTAPLFKPAPPPAIPLSRVLRAELLESLDKQRKARLEARSRAAEIPPDTTWVNTFAARKFADKTFGIPSLNVSSTQPGLGSETLTPTTSAPSPYGQLLERVDPPQRRNRKRRRRSETNEIRPRFGPAPTPWSDMPRPALEERLRPSLIDSVSDTVLERIMTAMAVTRTLIGGVDSAIHWDLMGTLFPDVGTAMMRRLWPRVMKTFPSRFSDMKAKFQDVFIHAYESGLLPSIDFNDLESYPWNDLIDWAVEALDEPVIPQENVFPSTREQFERTFSHTKDNRPSSCEMFASYTFVTQPERQYVLSNVCYASPGDPDDDVVEGTRFNQFASVQDSDKELLILAKSWIRQNAATPVAVYSAEVAKEKLAKLALHTLELATKTLVAEKVINPRDRKMKNYPGRAWDVSETFLAAIDKRRIITAKNIRRASHYKEILDNDFSAMGYSDVDVLADDGDVFAVFHLLNDGLITLESDDVPGNESGLGDKSKYQTRQMDKNLLHFNIQIHPTPSYDIGPLSEDRKITLPPPIPPPYNKPLNNLSNFTPEFLPLWYDVHGTFFRLMWDMLVSAICGLVVLRPGLILSEIHDHLKPAVEQWELKLCMEWLVAVGLVRDENGLGTYRLNQGWWVRLGEYLGEEVEWGGDENGEGKGRVQPIQWLAKQVPNVGG